MLKPIFTLSPNFIKKSFLIALIGLFVLSACQKEITPENEPPPTPPPTLPQNDSTLLSMFVELDSTVASPFDTISKGLYTYDSQKRLIKYDYVYYDAGVIAVPPGLQFTNTYFYLGNDTLPFKEIDYVNEQGLIFIETIYHFYTTGKPIKDSVVFGSGRSLVHKYYYLLTKVVDSTTQYSPTAPFVASYGYSVFYKEFANNNIVSNKDSFFLADNTTPLSYRLLTVDNYAFTYDSFKNPLYRFNHLDPYYSGYFPKLNGYEALGKNNLLDYTHVRVGTLNDLNEQTISRYEYNTNGYPKIVRTADVNSPLDYFKGLYFYTK